MWYGHSSAERRRLSLRVQQRTAELDPTRPWEHAFYQPPRLLAMVRRQVEQPADSCDAAALATELDGLVAAGSVDGFADAVVDGVVPTALVRLLECVGVPVTERGAAAAGIIAMGSEELQWQELRRGEEQTRTLQQLGLPVEGPRGGGRSHGMERCMGCKRRHSIL